MVRSAGNEHPIGPGIAGSTQEGPRNEVRPADVGNQRVSRSEGHMMERDRAPNGVEPERSEDDIQREQLGPRGVPGAPDPAKMTPQREKKTPKHIDPRHVS